jgi:HEAT repeat protein
LPLAKDEDWQVRFRLAIALGNFEKNKVEKVLNELAQDPFEQVAKTAQDILSPHSAGNSMSKHT